MLVSIADQHGQNKSLPWRELGFYAYQHRCSALEHTMQTTTCPSTISLHRTWHQRLLDTSLADVVLTLRQAWQARSRKLREQRELAAVAEMNELLLRDIGAPDWMVAEAAARRDVDRLRAQELRNEQLVGRMRGLQ